MSEEANSKNTHQISSSSSETSPNKKQKTMASKVASLTIKEFFANRAVPKITTICGSQRVGSFNKMLHDNAVKIMQENGAIVHPIDLEQLNLPLYDPNSEENAFPDGAKLLKSQLVETDGIFIACPEYNGFVSPLMLNAITWATRGEGDMYSGFKSKIVSVMATSPGPMGGLRMIRSLNQMLQDMGATVLPGHNALGNSFKIFDPKDGTIIDEGTKAKLNAACFNLIDHCRYQANRDQDCAVAKDVLRLSNMGEYGQVDLP